MDGYGEAGAGDGVFICWPDGEGGDLTEFSAGWGWLEEASTAGGATFFSQNGASLSTSKWEPCLIAIDSLHEMVSEIT